MAGDGKTCRILTCREDTGGRVHFCSKHNLMWVDSGERRRLVAAAQAGGEPVGAVTGKNDDPRLNRALMDFINRIDAEDRNGTANGK